MPVTLEVAQLREREVQRQLQQQQRAALDSLHASKGVGHSLVEQLQVASSARFVR